MYSVEWRKRGLPHVHILLWTVEKIRTDEINTIICAEIPDPETDPELYEVVTTNMINGPCGDHNRKSSCMIKNKCSKRYPRVLLVDTITGNDGYLLYRYYSIKDNSRTITLKVNNMYVVVDNSWIVPYSPFLSKTFKAHCNFKYCSFVKSIKYVCKYVTKGSDKAVFGIATPDSNDEVSQYHLGGYVSSNEEVWRIFSVSIYECHHTVVHLAVQLENGQRVNFMAANVVQRAE